MPLGSVRRVSTVTRRSVEPRSNASSSDPLALRLPERGSCIRQRFHPPRPGRSRFHPSWVSPSGTSFRPAASEFLHLFVGPVGRDRASCPGVLPLVREAARGACSGVCPLEQSENSLVASLSLLAVGSIRPLTPFRELPRAGTSTSRFCALSRCGVRAPVLPGPGPTPLFRLPLVWV
jgi:hypothetical protein